MSEDPIRDLLATVAQATMGLPAGHLAAWFGHVEAHGGDIEAVRAWVEAHGGAVDYPERPEETGLRAGQYVASARPRPGRFIIPASALNLPS